MIGLLDQVVGDVRRTLLVLFGSVALVLLIACANCREPAVDARGGAAARMAVRAALGAGWQRLMRQLLTESVLLSLIGGIVGIAIAQVACRSFARLTPAIFRVSKRSRLTPASWRSLLESHS